MERGPSLSPNRRPHQPLQSGATETRSLRGRARRCGSARWGGRPGAASPPRCLRGGSGRGPAPWAVNKDAGQVPSALWSALSGDPVGSAGLASAFARFGGGRLSSSYAVLAHAARALQPAQLQQLSAVRAAPPCPTGIGPGARVGGGGQGSVGCPGQGGELRGPGVQRPRCVPLLRCLPLTD